MNYNWIIFDADGTLFDYDQAENEAIQHTFDYFGYEFKSDYVSLYRQCNKQLWDAFEKGELTLEKLKVERFELYLKALDIDNDAQKFSDRYLYYLGLGTQLIDGAEHILDSLSGKAGLIMMTNGIKEVQRSRLNLSPIQSYFSDIIISDEVGVAKQDNRIFEIAMENMTISDKRSVIIVGDNLSSDIKGGIDFGIDTCWFNPKQIEFNPEIQATYEVQKLEDLLPIVGIN